ncbi:MAG: TlpA family protein disulfide reductase [Candidatus Heimdallarchaeaceae archaeon]
MKLSARNGLLVLFLILTGTIIPFSHVYANSHSNADKQSIFKVEVGALAPDFSITDVDSGITYKLSDFKGKAVMIDFFATWCTYCRQEIPHLVDLYEIFPKDELQIISVDVDSSETEKEVSDFRKAYDMNWIVGIDIDDSIGEAYGVGGIPHLVIIDQNQYVTFELIGFTESYAPAIKNALYDVIPDTTDPLINDYIVNIVGDNLSIFSNELRIIGNITEDREVKEAILKITGSNGDTLEVTLAPRKELSGYYYINETVALDPSFLYPQDSLDLALEVKDYVNTASSNKVSLNVERYKDSIEPIINNIVVKVEEKSADEYKITVTAEIEEDLFLVDAKSILLKNYEPWYPKPLEQLNSSHWETSYSLSKSIVHLCELNVSVNITDVAGNNVNKTVSVPTDLDPTGCEAEQPTDGDEPSDGEEPTDTERTPFLLIIYVVLTLIGTTVIFRRIRDRRKK